MWPKLFTWPWCARVTSVRPACLYIYKSLANEKKLVCLYTFPDVRVCTRCAHISNLHVHNNTHLSSPLIRPSHSVFPRVKDVTVRIIDFMLIFSAFLNLFFVKNTWLLCALEFSRPPDQWEYGKRSHVLIAVQRIFDERPAQRVCQKEKGFHKQNTAQTKFVFIYKTCT